MQGGAQDNVAASCTFVIIVMALMPAQYAQSKDPKIKLQKINNTSRLSAELPHHPDTNFTDYQMSGFKPGVESLLTQHYLQ